MTQEKIEQAKLMVEMGDRLHGVDTVQERNNAGFNKPDYSAWPQVRGNAADMAALLKKYLQTQLSSYGEPGAEAIHDNYEPSVNVEVVMANLPKIIPTLNPVWGSVVMEYEGEIPAAVRNQYIWIQKHFGLWWDRKTNRNYVQKKNIQDFRFDSYRQYMGALGFIVADMPDLSKAAPQIEITTIEAAISALDAKRGMDLFVCHQVGDKFVFRFSYSTQLNELFGNKNSKISGITEAISPTHKDVDLYGTWARITDSLPLAEEIILKAKVLLPQWTFFTDISSSKAVIDARQIEITAPIPEVVKELNPAFTLYPFQNEGVRFIESSGGNCLLGYDMGLGKTLVSLSWCAINKRRILVVCPLVVRLTWLQEATKFFPGYFKSKELRSSTLKNHGQPDLSDFNIVTINFASLPKFLPAIRSAGFDTLILDESHYIKNEKALITKVINSIGDLFKHKILLSGTAIKNKKEEFYTQVELIRPGFFKSKKSVKMSTIGGLWHDIQAFYTTKSKQEVLKDLPSKTHAIIEIEVKKCPDIVGRISFEKIAALKSAVSLAKADATIEFIRELLASSDSCCLMFSDSLDVVRKIYKELGDDVCIMHHGQMSTDKRTLAKESFENINAKQRVFVSTRQSLAVGATIVRADKVIFNDCCWTMADIFQAEDRCYRIGQKKPVISYWIKAAKNRWDDKVIGVLAKKLDISRKCLEGKQVSKEEREWMEKSIAFEDFKS